MVGVRLVVAPPGGGDMLALRDFFFLFFSRENATVKPVNRFLHAIAQKTRFHARKCLLGVKNYNFFDFGFFPLKPLKSGRGQAFPMLN